MAHPSSQTLMQTMASLDLADQDEWNKSICPLSFRCAAVGDHVLLWLHVCLGQLLCVHDFLPCMCVTGAGGKATVLHFMCVRVCVLMSFWLMCCVLARIVVPGESGGPSYLAAEPLLQSDGGGGGQQTQPCNPESQNDHGNTSLDLFVSLPGFEHECGF